jgi:hypothetical protein
LDLQKIQDSWRDMAQFQLRLPAHWHPTESGNALLLILKQEHF